MDTKENNSTGAGTQAEVSLTAEVTGEKRGEVRLNLGDGWTYAYLRTLEAANKLARAVNAHEDLVAALKALKLECLADHLNPCWDNRPTDNPGKHWGGSMACTSCNARAALAKAEGRGGRQ